MNKIKIAVASAMLVGFGVVLAYAFPLEPTPEQKQKDFISCLEQNLLNTQHDCMSKLIKR